jgi:hypothetical protein
VRTKILRAEEYLHQPEPPKTIPLIGIIERVMPTTSKTDRKNHLFPEKTVAQRKKGNSGIFLTSPKSHRRIDIFRFLLIKNRLSK